MLGITEVKAFDILLALAQEHGLKGALLFIFLKPIEESISLLLVAADFFDFLTVRVFVADNTTYNADGKLSLQVLFVLLELGYVFISMRLLFWLQEHISKHLNLVLLDLDCFLKLPVVLFMFQL